ncbi:hypothetical protein LIER_20554 [Lithospermum erythrorhizon]|uniref:Uncharacterized protein n=1 Tax=Lithospermum erythrorhizon TaxID=34254 RepID=A0AAV3QLY1_LITER
MDLQQVEGVKVADVARMNARGQVCDQAGRQGRNDGPHKDRGIAPALLEKEHKQDDNKYEQIVGHKVQHRVSREVDSDGTEFGKATDVLELHKGFGKNGNIQQVEKQGSPTLVLQQNSSRNGISETTCRSLSTLDNVDVRRGGNSIGPAGKIIDLVSMNNTSLVEWDVNPFIKYIDSLKQQFENADSATIARIAESPSTKAFLKNQFEHHFVEEDNALSMDCDVVDKPDFPQQQKTTNMVSPLEEKDKGPLVTILPKLCYEQVHQAWSTTVQVAQLGEGPGIVTTALLQLKDQGRLTNLRGQGLPFDDKG